MTIVLILGLLMLAIALPLAARRVIFLYRIITAGQPAPDRVQGVVRRIGAALRTQLVEVFGQKKLLKWTVPGAAHFFVFWAFVILATVYLEAFGVLFSRNPKWAIPLVGHWWILGFLQDFIAVMCLIGIVTFAAIRVRNSPEKLGRRSRFKGSHLTGAYVVLFMIFNVLWTMFLFRGAGSALGNYDNSGAFVSNGVGSLLGGLGETPLEVLERVGLLLHIGVMLVFLIDVLHSKHLHIFVAPLNVLFGRHPVALGAAKPLMSDGKALTLEDIEDLDEDTKLGVGAVEDFSWKGMLDFATCTECGRCQDQCPAWNTEKPLSPKLMIMALRDHAFAKAPYLLAEESKREELVGANAGLAREVERPLVGDTGDDWFYMPENGGGVIDPDVLWSCVTCGACVNQCPVDIEHVDHIIDMRRYQVLIESNFPAELNQLFKGMENKGNPWNMSPTMRMDWAKGLDFEVPVVGKDVESAEDVEWLFWVGCAGAYEDRAKKTTAAVAELLHTAGVKFAVLGNGETCTGDSARRAGNEFLFQGLAQQNVETFKEHKVQKVVSTCAHCFNTLKNEYRELGIELDVVHHTQLLNRLVQEKKLTPVAGGGQKRTITWHDPCYIGRHNHVYEAPRELLNVIPDSEFTEMPRNSERSFCCGAGGARMWMEETIGQRINNTRTQEAVDTGAEQIAVGCPFCRVMLSDGLTNSQSEGNAREEVEVLDVAQMLLASVKGQGYQPKSGTGAKEKTANAAADVSADGLDAGGAKTALKERQSDEPADRAAGGGGSLFDTPNEPSGAEVTAAAGTTGATEERADDTLADESRGTDLNSGSASSGGSLFDNGGSLFDTPDEAASTEETEQTAKQGQPQSDEPVTKSAEETAGSADQADDQADSTGGAFSGGSLFDTPDEAASTEETEQTAKQGQPQSDEPVTKAAEEAEGAADQADDQADSTGGAFSGGSLFDTPAQAASTEETEQTAKQGQPQSDEPVSRSAEETAEGTAAASSSTEASAEASAEAEVEIGSGSLFDLKAPEPSSSGTTSTADSRSSEHSSSDASSADTGETEVRSLKDIKTEHSEHSGDSGDSGEACDSGAGQQGEDSATADAEPEPTTVSEPAEASETSEEQAEQPAGETAPPPAGGSHQPATDKDISGAGSLFDL